MVLAPIIQTSRLTLRALTSADINIFAETIFGDTDIGWRYGLVADTTTAETILKSTQEWIAAANENWKTHAWGGWAICSADEALAPMGEFLGFCGFFEPDIGDDPSLVYGVAKKYWRNGIATEAAIAALHYLFTQTSILQVQTVAHPTVNIGSAQVLEKAGLCFIGEIDYHDSVAQGIGWFVHYKIDRDAWLKQNSDKSIIPTQSH